MDLTFYKYQGTGNDFILVDNREAAFPSKDQQYISRLCQRHMGIGADGLILLENDPDSDFRMVYYNADGQEGSMCGNGGRCIVAFARKLNLISESAVFSASDGLHEASIHGDIISLKMQNVTTVREKPGYLFLNTGSPHHIQIVEDLEHFDVHKEGKRLRYSLYGEKGSNINFVEPVGENSFTVRTYERGVEDETLSCGTGVTAVALAMHHLGHTNMNKVSIRTLGGTLEVGFQKGEDHYTDIYLKGPAKEVFKGTITC